MREVRFVLEEEVSWRGRSRCGARRGSGSRKGRQRPCCFRPKEEEDPGGQVGRLGQVGCEARWAGVVSVWAGLQAKAQRGGGQWAGPICGKMKKSIPNLIFWINKDFRNQIKKFLGSRRIG
jgi:hypothetical protein